MTVAEVPGHYLRYTLPSRYCDSDRLMTFAAQQFGNFPEGLPRVQAICDWVHKNIQYRWGSGSPQTAASEILAQGYGLTWEFAHLAVCAFRGESICQDALNRGQSCPMSAVSFGSPMDATLPSPAGLRGATAEYLRRALQ